jgi:hypothetical protein
MDYGLPGPSGRHPPPRRHSHRRPPAP